MVKRKKAIFAYLWWASFGLLGAHQFYLRRVGLGCLYFVTLGFLGIGWLIDGFTLYWQVKKVNASGDLDQPLGPVARQIIAIPWWGVFLAGVALVGLAIYFSTSFHTPKLIRGAANVEQQRILEDEVQFAASEIGTEALQTLLERMNYYVSDQKTQAELSKALQDLQAAKRLSKPRNQQDNSVETQHAFAKEVESIQKELAAFLEENVTSLQALPELEWNTLDTKQSWIKDLRGAERRLQKIRLSAEQLSLPIQQKASSQQNTVDGATLQISPELRQRIKVQLEEDMQRLAFGVFLIFFLVIAFILLVLTKISLSTQRGLQVRAVVSEKKAAQTLIEKQLTEARMTVLQAQIEPHFLFNTLASVLELIEVNPEAAAKMQSNLIKYLRAALPKMRSNTTTLGQEAEMVEVYLELLKVRMEERLQFEITIPQELYPIIIPPMMVLTLVENSIKHGLEPKPEGGRITVVAKIEQQKLYITVADTGLGFAKAKTSGTGVGLANIRERLTAIYGQAASLLIEENSEEPTNDTTAFPVDQGRTAGAEITLVLPLTTTPLILKEGGQ